MVLGIANDLFFQIEGIQRYGANHDLKLPIIKVHSTDVGKNVLVHHSEINTDPNLPV